MRATQPLHTRSFNQPHHTRHYITTTSTPMHDTDAFWECEFLRIKADLRKAMEPQQGPTGTSSRCWAVELYTLEVDCRLVEIARRKSLFTPPPLQHPPTQPHHAATPLPHAQPTPRLPPPYI
ncbi:hypothetical protein Pcinc_010558 [Petrolisthes cinctipes]|uniref:Uncharacterized protein n=1 Tax=Petrolisthes cinctipes TaxID=88211 RepID=A0AAE1G4N2_PETCI|nr:hypothetical protein Pcinc_010558 [Petrolisthes cinctipes]